MFLPPSLRLSTITLAALTVSALALPQPLTLASQDTITSELHPMTWTGSLTPGGDNITIQGSVQEIVARIADLNPDFVQEIENRGIENRIETRVNDPYPPFGKPNCQIFNTAAYKPALLNSIKYITGLGGDCHFPPLTCSKLSCAFNGGIFLCNDANTPLSLPCNVPARYAQKIADACTRDSLEVHGQLFTQRTSSQNWNVVVADGAALKWENHCVPGKMIKRGKWSHEKSD